MSEKADGYPDYRSMNYTELLCEYFTCLNGDSARAISNLLIAGHLNPQDFAVSALECLESWDECKIKQEKLRNS